MRDLERTGVRLSLIQRSPRELVRVTNSTGQTQPSRLQRSTPTNIEHRSDHPHQNK